MDKKETKKVAPSESSKYLSFKEEKVTTTFDEKEQAPISSEDARLEKIRKKALANQRLRVHKKMLAEEKLHKKERKSADKENFISLHNINKIYDNHVQAVYNFNLDIKKQEFIVLVGPSGCGKSTTLRMIAGLESITGGDLFIDGVYANDLEPKNRDIAMVFQSYALYPHMSVEANMGFGLKIRKIPKPIFDRSGKPVTKINKGLIADCRRERNDLVSLYNEIRTSNPEKAKEVEKDIDEMTQKINYLSTTPVQVYKQCHIDKKEIKSRVMNAAKILQIEEYLDRKPKALSGGQCQRVALGRAIVRNAKVFLMDEPLSNLDAKLRVQMRSEIIKLHNQLNATTVYVTHDQTEAMTMASRIVVMSKGYVQQIGTPLEIYNHPANIFVATFIGSPSMNLFNGPFEKGTFLFSNGAKLALPAEFATAVETFYKNELVNNQKEIDSITNDFVELQELLRKRSELSSRGASVHEVDEEIKAVESSNERLSFLKKNIAQYQEFLSKKKYDVIFGIRPEDIFEKHQTPTSSSLSPIIKTNIAVSEILGNEYFVHINFAGKDLVAKIASKTLISSGENIEIVFDLDRAHLFDQASGKLII